MKLAVMQPYFFPYQGYIALMHYADELVLFDTAQFDRKGWMHRNRTLKPGGGWQYVRAGVSKPPFRAAIQAVELLQDGAWQAQLLRQLEHYRHLGGSFDETVELVRSVVSEPLQTLVALNLRALQAVRDALGITCRIHVLSDMDLTLSNVTHAGQWALRIAEAVGAREYVNPIGGRQIFLPDEFDASGIRLSFLEHNLPAYDQHQAVFEPGLSIIDTLMLEGAASSAALVSDYTVHGATPA